MKKEIQFVYTLRHPICQIVKFTNNPVIAEQHKKEGWDVTCRNKHFNKKFNKHLNNNCQLNREGC